MYIDMPLSILSATFPPSWSGCCRLKPHCTAASFQHQPQFSRKAALRDGPSLRVTVGQRRRRRRHNDHWATNSLQHARRRGDHQQLRMSGRYAFAKGVKELRFLFCQTSQHSAEARCVVALRATSCSIPCWHHTT